jgi:hypothetical protein
LLSTINLIFSVVKYIWFYWEFVPEGLQRSCMEGAHKCSVGCTKSPLGPSCYSPGTPLPYRLLIGRCMMSRGMSHLVYLLLSPHHLTPGPQSIPLVGQFSCVWWREWCAGAWIWGCIRMLPCL